MDQSMHHFLQALPGPPSPRRRAKNRKSFRQGKATVMLGHPPAKQSQFQLLLGQCGLEDPVLGNTTQGWRFASSTINSFPTGIVTEVESSTIVVEFTREDPARVLPRPAGDSSTSPNLECTDRWDLSNLGVQRDLRWWLEAHRNS